MVTVLFTFAAVQTKKRIQMEINFKEIAMYVGIVFVGALAAVVAYSAYKEYQEKASATITTK
jgi:arginine exporter protein ArgO